VATWAEFERAAPGLAAVAARLWPGITALDRGEAPPADGPCFRIAYLATVRRDGGPRLHPFCPIIAGGRLYAAIPLASPKGHDLRRDPRCVVHAMPGPEDDELCIRAVAHEVADDDTRATVIEIVRSSGVGGMLVSVTRDPLFELDLERVDVARWFDIGQPGTWAERASWSAAAP
jgi:pyridoxamine 5'-phosphate oxidase-like protein